MPRVEIFHWNPRERFTPTVWGRRIEYGPRLENFGDLLGPVVVEGLARQLGVDLERPVRSTRLLSIGSVMHFAKPGSVVWGTGVNGKMSMPERPLRDLDVRAVRGPWTREFLRARGVEVPEVYGDPGLLVPRLRPELVGRERTRPVLAVPNLNDIATYRSRCSLEWISPRAHLDDVLGAISTSRLVVGSSLHAIIVAEALGIPARLVLPGAEHSFKYDDYYRGTGRDGYTAAHTPEEAAAMGGEEPPQFDPAPLVNAFPADLWQTVSQRSDDARALT